MNNLKYVAYTVTHYEQSCGCSASDHYWIYDDTGNKPKLFDTRESAVSSAISAMCRRDADNYIVLEDTSNA